MENFLVLIVLLGLVSVVLAAISFVALIVSKLMHKDSVAKVSECVLWWGVFPVVLPFRARKLGVLRKSIYVWLLTLLSPFVVSIVLDVTMCVKIYLPDITHKDVVAITGITDFPEFEYRRYFIRFGMPLSEGYFFKDETEAERLFEKIESLIADGENTFWTKDTIVNVENILRFDSDVVYTYNRSWDTMYMKASKDVKVPRIARITIGRDGLFFDERHDCKWGMDYYSNVDCLSLLTGVAFPRYMVVDMDYNDYSFAGHSWCATLKFEEKPGDAFVQTVQETENWKKCDDGIYVFYVEDREGQGVWERITIDPDNCVAKLNVGHCYYRSDW